MYCLDIKIYETPGGTVEKGEKNKEALSRELLEELGIIVKPDNLVMFDELYHQIPDTNEKLYLYFYTCYHWEGEPEIKPGIHDDSGWYTINNLPNMVKLNIEILHKLKL